jgi:hypothetical protein
VIIPYTEEDVLRGIQTAYTSTGLGTTSPTRPRASMLAQCSRENAYYLGNVIPATIRNDGFGDSTFTQEQGRLAEDITVAGIEAIGTVRVVNRQIELPDSSIVSGHPDGELEFRSDTGSPWSTVDSTGKKWGWEHKHFGRFGYKDIAEQGLFASHPDILAQTALYGLALEWDMVSIVITSQDASSIKFELRKMRRKVNPKMMVFNIDLTNDVYPLLSGPLKDRAEALQRVAEGLVKPEDIEREFDGTKNFPCGYCVYQDRCKLDGQGTVKVPQLPLRRI